MENVSCTNPEGPPQPDPNRKFLNRFQYVADNAKNDPKAPVFLNGLFRGYLAFDTGQPFHYRVSAVRKQKLKGKMPLVVVQK